MNELQNKNKNQLSSIIQTLASLMKEETNAQNNKIPRINKQKITEITSQTSRQVNLKFNIKHLFPREIQITKIATVVLKSLNWLIFIEKK